MAETRPVVAVVGAGRMGIGIAQVFASAGYQVNLIDLKKRSPEDSLRVLETARQQLQSSLSMLSALGVTDETTVRIVSDRVHYFERTLADKPLQEAAVVFEAVPEVLEAKEMTLAEISAKVGVEALIASTTSTFMVGTLAIFVSNPQRFMNTHWLNPAYLMPLVEVSPAPGTSVEATGEMLRLLQEVGKVPVKCAPSPGFIVPRIQALAMNEAARLVEERVATPADIDKACKVGFGLRFAVLGLLEFIDWGGGDILYYADSYLAKTVDANRFAPPEIVEQNMAEGKTGLRSGTGFYEYKECDISEYQKETMRKFVDLLNHLGLLVYPKGD